MKPHYNKNYKRKNVYSEGGGVVTAINDDWDRGQYRLTGMQE